jgi:hypothetical protein
MKKMIEKEVSERIIDNIGKYLGLRGSLNDGFIYAPIEKPFDARILKTISIHYNIRNYIKVSKTMNKPFVLVVF